MKTRNVIAIVLILLLGAVVTWLLSDRNPSGDQPESGRQEAHGGHEEKEGEMKRLNQKGLTMEIGLSEEEGPPRIEAFFSKNGKQIDPRMVQLEVNLIRANGTTEALSFDAAENHLISLQAIPEPHVFNVDVKAHFQDKMYQWNYWQVERGIELSSADLKDAGIELKTAGPADIKTELTLPAQIEVNPRRLAHVVPRVEGVVTEVGKYLGDRVETGEILAILESRDLADLKSQYLVAVRRLDLARAGFERERTLWKEQISAEADYLVAKNELATAKALSQAAAQKLIAFKLSPNDLKRIASGRDRSFSRYEIRAPFTGEVVQIHIALGEPVNPNTKVYTIADLSNVWGAITVYTKNLEAVHVGQTVRIRANDSGIVTNGTVFYIGPMIDEQTRSTKAYVEIANPDAQWRPGMFVTAELLKNTEKARVAVTADAIHTDQDQSLVFVRHDDIFEPRLVVPGKRDEHRVEIREGLREGERYASRNSYVLKSELDKSSAVHSH